MPASSSKGRSSFTFPAPNARRGGTGGAADDALVDSLVSRFNDINTAFDHDRCVARLVEVAKPQILSPADARALLEASGWNLRSAIKTFVARRLRATPAVFEQPGSDSDGSDEDDADEPRIRPVYRTKSGRGIRMKAADRIAALRRVGAANNIQKERRLPPRQPRAVPKAIGARFHNDYGDSLQLYWDAPGPNPRGSFLQGTILPGGTLGMKSYVGHAFHAELAGERVWSCVLNTKPRQFYTIDRSQVDTTTQDLFANWSMSDTPSTSTPMQSQVANSQSLAGAFWAAENARAAREAQQARQVQQQAQQAQFGAGNSFGGAAAGSAIGVQPGASQDADSMEDML